MEPEIKQKLYKEVTEIRNILFAAQTSFKIVDYLYRTREGLEIEVINNSQYLQYAAQSQWRIYVTEISKLFKKGKNDHFNIHQFTDKFKPGGIYCDPLISHYSVRIWEDNLSLKKEKELMANLALQRDSLYSHTDRERQHIKNALSFADANEFLNIVKRTLSEIYIVIFGEPMQMEPFNEPVDNLKHLIRILVEEKKIWLDLEKKLDDED